MGPQQIWGHKDPFSYLSFRCLTTTFFWTMRIVIPMEKRPGSGTLPSGIKATSARFYERFSVADPVLLNLILLAAPLDRSSSYDDIEFDFSFHQKTTFISPISPRSAWCETSKATGVEINTDSKRHLWSFWHTTWPSAAYELCFPSRVLTVSKVNINHSRSFLSFILFSCCVVSLDSSQCFFTHRCLQAVMVP